jgi:hypothetical protein
MEAPMIIRVWVVGDWDFEFQVVYERPVMFDPPPPYVSKTWKQGDEWFVRHHDSSKSIKVEFDDYEDEPEENKEFMKKLSEGYIHYLTDSLLSV